MNNLRQGYVHLCFTPWYTLALSLLSALYSTSTLSGHIILSTSLRLLCSSNTCSLLFHYTSISIPIHTFYAFLCFILMLIRLITLPSFTGMILFVPLILLIVRFGIILSSFVHHLYTIFIITLTKFILYLLQYVYDQCNTWKSCNRLNSSKGKLL
jgi:hypothetical protein